VGDWWTVLITAVAAVIASSGFWTFVIRRNEKHSMTSALMMGIAYEKITSMSGIEQMDLLDAQRSIVLARTSNGLNLSAVPLP